MTLIKSISGIRGTIGGLAGEGLTPADVLRFSCAFAQFLSEQSGKERIRVIVGRDARISGTMVNMLVCGALMSMGADVVDLGLSTTPTVEMTVTDTKADGGIIITASHNPMQWNALKLLNAKGEFLDNATAAAFISMSENPKLLYKEVTKIGTYSSDEKAITRHIAHVLNLPLVDVEAIKAAGFKVALDGVNSTGGLAVVPLLNALGVKTVNELYCTPDGKFPHNPEPLPENLQELAQTVIKTKSDVGFAVDPDVDRLAIVDENGEMFGEEYTLVAVADYVLQHKKGNTVSNLSSTSALRDVTLKHGGEYYPSAVGEVNVVDMMKSKTAVIGGEGNGGVIYPELHYGRDALVGIALFLSHLAKAKMSCSRLRQTYPDYYISKNKIEVRSETEINTILEKIKSKYAKQPINSVDGVRIDFDNAWVHLRRSNTEPIIRIYAESDSMNKSEHLAHKLVEDIRDVLKLETEEDN